MIRTDALPATLLMLSAISFGQTTQENPALLSLVEAERSFARTSLEIGARPAFMKFFADDAVVFRPHPVRYKEAMKSVPMPAKPLETTLAWEPLYADISLAGDIGYTTGPSVWTDHTAAKRPPYYGYYFSVWKKQPTGEWKVVFDVGTEQPGPHTGPRTLQLPSTMKRGVADPAIGQQERIVSLMNAEQEFLDAANTGGGVTAILKYAAGDARVYREKHMPIVGKDSLQSFFSARLYLTRWQPTFCDVAQSGDLGYVYGSYETEQPENTQASVEKGYYLRVWKRDESSTWRFVSEVTSVLPPDPPKGKK